VPREVCRAPAILRWVSGVSWCILPVSSLQSGAYGLRDVAITVPTVVGRTGVIGTIEVELWPREKIALQQSAEVLKEKIAKVLSVPRTGTPGCESDSSPAVRFDQPGCCLRGGWLGWARLA
jgi:hypothetical protein